MLPEILELISSSLVSIILVGISVSVENLFERKQSELSQKQFDTFIVMMIIT